MVGVFATTRRVQQHKSNLSFTANGSIGFANFMLLLLQADRSQARGRIVEIWMPRHPSSLSASTPLLPGLSWQQQLPEFPPSGTTSNQPSIQLFSPQMNLRGMKRRLQSFHVTGFVLYPIAFRPINSPAASSFGMTDGKAGNQSNNNKLKWKAINPFQFCCKILTRVFSWGNISRKLQSSNTSGVDST